MLGGCHLINPPRCGFHYAPGWGDVKKKLRATSCELRAGRRRSREPREEAASCKLRRIDLDLALDLESPRVVETTERKLRARRKERTGSKPLELPSSVQPTGRSTQ